LTLDPPIADRLTLLFAHAAARTRSPGCHASILRIARVLKNEVREIMGDYYAKPGARTTKPDG